MRVCHLGLLLRFGRYVLGDRIHLIFEPVPKNCEPLEFISMVLRCMFIRSAGFGRIVWASANLGELRKLLISNGETGTFELGRI